MSDLDLDTGKRSMRGVNPLADHTYADLVARLARRKVAAIRAALRNKHQ